MKNCSMVKNWPSKGKEFLIRKRRDITHEWIGKKLNLDQIIQDLSIDREINLALKENRVIGHVGSINYLNCNQYDIGFAWNIFSETNNYLDLKSVDQGQYFSSDIWYLTRYIFTPRLGQRDRYFSIYEMSRDLQKKLLVIDCKGAPSQGSLTIDRIFKVLTFYDSPSKYILYGIEKLNNTQNSLLYNFLPLNKRNKNSVPAYYELDKNFIQFVIDNKLSLKLVRNSKKDLSGFNDNKSFDIIKNGIPYVGSFSFPDVVYPTNITLHKNIPIIKDLVDSGIVFPKKNLHHEDITLFSRDTLIKKRYSGIRYTNISPDLRKPSSNIRTEEIVIFDPNREINSNNLKVWGYVELASNFKDKFGRKGDFIIKKSPEFLQGGG